MAVPHSNSGLVVGFILGFFQSVYNIFNSGISMISMVSWGAIWDTAVLTFIGGIVGWCGSQLMQFLKLKYKQYKSK